ncbi:Hypothetical protein GSB_154583 [Giardia duodenalis]|uniref:Uncharacterized protein n=1 Tax=Giardia intestinalis TaxID=5741 RepID=V6TT71_GIAIN|nr:Hypothetical protein GSB_154583 [Giardia intestinalis]
MTQTSPELQTLLAALLAKLEDSREPRPTPQPQPQGRRTRMKEVPITAREDPDIDPYEVLPPIDRTTHEYVFCRNGRWRAVPRQMLEQIKERTEKMLETKLRKRAEATRRMEESAVEAPPVEKKAKPAPAAEPSEHSVLDEEDPEVAKVIADHLADKMRREQMTRSQAAASSSVFGVTVTHK